MQIICAVYRQCHCWVRLEMERHMPTRLVFKLPRTAPTEVPLRRLPQTLLNHFVPSHGSGLRAAPTHWRVRRNLQLQVLALIGDLLHKRLSNLQMTLVLILGGWVLDDGTGLTNDQFIAPLTKALQEAIAKIETLEAKVHMIL